MVGEDKGWDDARTRPKKSEKSPSTPQCIQRLNHFDS